MNRTLILLLLFVFLGGGTYYLLNKEKKSASLDITYDTNFTVDNKDDIYKIFIADRKGNQTTLTRQKDYWVTAEGHKARQRPVSFILKMLEKLEYRYLLSKPEAANVVKSFATQGIKVEVYDKADKELLVFYVGPNSRDHEGSYMIKDGSNNPQLMNIPGHVGELRPFFELKGDDWRDRTILDYEQSEIASVAIEYPKQKSKSFKLTIENGKNSIEPLDQFTPKKSGKLNESILENFLTSFENKIAEDFRNNMPNSDSLMASIPFANLTIKHISGEERSLRFIPLVNLNTDAEGKPISGNDATLRYFTHVNEEDIYLTQHQALSGIFPSYDSFFR